MHKNILMKKLNDYSEMIAARYPDIKKVLLFGAWLEGMARETDEIEVAVVFDWLNEDLLDTREELEKMGHSIDKRIEPVIIEAKRKDPIGFLTEILENGHLVYEKK